MPDRAAFFGPFPSYSVSIYLRSLEKCGLKAVQAGRSFDAVAIGDLAYNEIPVSRLKEAGRHRLSERCLTMVRTNLPHNVHMGSKDRWCVSARAFESTPGLWSLARDKMEAAILR